MDATNRRFARNADCGCGARSANQNPSMTRAGFVRTLGVGAAALGAAAAGIGGIARAQPAEMNSDSRDLTLESFAAPGTTPQPISAEEAFDKKAAKQANVVILDVRTPEELRWNGTAAMVNSLTTLDGAVFLPDFGKVLFIGNENVYEFWVNGVPQHIPVRQVASMSMSAIVMNIPSALMKYNYFAGGKCALVSRGMNFVADVAAKIQDLSTTILVMCRTGGRAYSAAVALMGYGYTNVYYIGTSPTGNAGSFSGSEYGNSYNGYTGFPGRNTSFKPLPSTAWCDAGLPIVTFCSPWTLRAGETPPWNCP